MIKDIDSLTMGGTVTEGICDNCHTSIFSCSEFQWESPELVSAPLLCESCGRKHNQSIGEDLKKIQELETKLKWCNEKLQEVLDFCEGRVEKLNVRKEELLKRLETL